MPCSGPGISACAASRCGPGCSDFAWRGCSPPCIEQKSPHLTMNRDEFLALALRNPVNVTIIDELARLALPDAWLVSGSLVQTAWNALTGRPLDHGIADYDVFYFDADTSWEAEDAVIRDVHARLGHLGVKVETRNQARVHLWYPGKHGLPYPPLTCSTD